MSPPAAPPPHMTIHARSHLYSPGDCHGPHLAAGSSVWLLLFAAFCDAELLSVQQRRAAAAHPGRHHFISQRRHQQWRHHSRHCLRWHWIHHRRIPGIPHRCQLLCERQHRGRSLGERPAQPHGGRIQLGASLGDVGRVRSTGQRWAAGGAIHVATVVTAARAGGTRNCG